MAKLQHNAWVDRVRNQSQVRLDKAIGLFEDYKILALNSQSIANRDMATLQAINIHKRNDLIDNPNLKLFFLCHHIKTFDKRWQAGNQDIQSKRDKILDQLNALNIEMQMEEDAQNVHFI